MFLCCILASTSKELYSCNRKGGGGLVSVTGHGTVVGARFPSDQPETHFILGNLDIQYCQKIRSN